MLSKLSDRLTAFFQPCESFAPPNLHSPHDFEHQLPGSSQKIRIFEDTWQKNDQICFLTKGPRRASVPQVTLTPNPAKLLTRLCSEQLKFAPLTALGPVELLNSEQEQIPLTPIEVNKSNSPTKFLPFSMSSDVGQLDSGLPQMSSEILLDLKVSRFQSMPL